MSLVTFPRQFLVDANGSPRIGAKAHFYQSGTTTPITTYTTPAYAVEHANPVLSVTGGFFPAVYINPSVNSTFKMVITDSSDVTIYTEDNIPALMMSQSEIGQAFYPRTAREISAGVTPTNYAYPEGNVLRYGADPTGVADSTDAFNRAISLGVRTFAPAGTYLVSNIGVVGGMHVEGDTDGASNGTTLLVGANNAGAFRHNSGDIIFFINICNLRIRAASGVTGARAYLQTDKSTYTAYANFDKVDTWKDLAIGYDGFFIFTHWDRCTDGYRGSNPVGQEHYFISSVPAAFGQVNSTNLNVVSGCRIFGATSGAPAAIDIGWGASWTICNGTDFEALETRAIRARAILGGSIRDCWFENIDAPDYCVTFASESSQSCGTWDISNNQIVMLNLGGTGFVSPDGTLVTMRTNTCTHIPAGKVLVNAAHLANVVLEHNRALSGDGAAGFINKLQDSDTSSAISLTLTGVGGTVSGNARYTYSAGLVTLEVPSLSGTSNSAACTLSTLPTYLRPASNKGDFPVVVADNGTKAFGYIQIDTNGVITAYRSATATGNDWTNSGTKSIQAFSVTYSLA